MTSKYPEELLNALLRSSHGIHCHGTANIPTPPPSKLLQARALSYLSKPTRSNRRLRNVCIAQRRDTTQTRSYATNSAQRTAGSARKSREIAVIGGGITGLTAAHYLARYAENAHITVYESSKKLGGWIDGKIEQVGPGENDKVLFQRGARMLRSGATSFKYDDLVLYDVLANLKLQEKILHPSGAVNDRYIYYPDHLVKLPGSNGITLGAVYSFLTEPLWAGCLKAGLRGWNSLYGYGRKSRLRSLMLKAMREAPDRQTLTLPRAALSPDESAAAFIQRLCGDERPVKNLLSAMFHGIYGGDVSKLSVKHTILDETWYRYHWPTLPVKDAFGREVEVEWMLHKDVSLMTDLSSSPNDDAIDSLAEDAQGENNRLIAFEDGLLSVVHALEKDLLRKENVTIRYDTPVEAIAYKNGGVEVSSSKEDAKQYDEVLSTIFSRQLAALVRPAGSLRTLEKTRAVTIMVVNLWYPNPHLLDGHHGFGYLIPQSVSSDLNPECALGVIFDSDVLKRPSEPLGTKLTVMLGGHYWDDWTFFPTEDMAVQMGLSVVQRHLGIPADEKVYGAAKLCRECLPQHYVGHRNEMARAHYELLGAFKGKLKVAGPSYTNVGFIPAMRAGYDAAMRIAKGRGPPYFARRNAPLSSYAHYFQESVRAGLCQDLVGKTGLEWATVDEEKAWATMKKERMLFREWSPLKLKISSDSDVEDPQALEEVIRQGKGRAVGKTVGKTMGKKK